MTVEINTVLVDRRDYPRKRFQNSRLSCVLSTDQIEIHQSQSRANFSINEIQNQTQSHLVHAIFSRALRKLQVTVRNSDWFVALFSPMVIGQTNYFGSSSSNVI